MIHSWLEYRSLDGLADLLDEILISFGDAVIDRLMDPLTK